MNRRIDLVGRKFGMLTVTSYSHSKYKLSYWNTICDCGNSKTIQGCHLKGKGTRSCGCLVRTDMAIGMNYKHGMYKTKTYKVWADMKSRCSNKNHSSYKYYGSRGIAVCDRWLKFENFLEDMGVKPEGLTIERVDNNGNYEPSNCKWATWGEQNSNKRKVSNIIENTTQDEQIRGK